MSTDGIIGVSLLCFVAIILGLVAYVDVKKTNLYYSCIKEVKDKPSAETILICKGK